MWQYNYTEQTELYHHNDQIELYHYGVKGMKWGERRAARIEKRVLKKYKKAAGWKGNEDFYREKAGEEYRKHDSKAKALDAQAKTYEKQGSHLKAEAARSAAAALRKRGENVRAQYDSDIEIARSRAERKMAKADKYAAKKSEKKGVTVDKSKIKSAMKKERDKVKQSLREDDIQEREERLREQIGDDRAYELLNRLRGRS